MDPMTSPGAKGIHRGGCQCGSLRYEIIGEPLEIYICHCTECRRQSSSAFGISVIIPRSAFTLIGGAAMFWSRPTATGGRLDCAFCPQCGVRLWHEEAGEDIISVKGGSLDDPPDLSRARHIWTASRLAGVVIPDGAICFAGEPDLT